MDNRDQSQRQPGSPALGGGSGGGGIEQFTKWVETADPQQLARITKTVLGRVGGMTNDPTSRDVFAREVGNDKSAVDGLTYLGQIASQHA